MPGEEHTFVFADLAGFTALTEAHGDERAADLATAFSSRVRELLCAHGGHEIKQLGDAVMLRVDEAAAAIGLATQIVEDASGRHGELDIRVGMHTGPAVERGGDWFGSTVNVAARVAARALGGEVLLTAPTRSAAARVLAGRTLQERGPHRFRNVSEPLDLWALIVAPDRAANGLPLDPVCRMAVDPDRGDHRIVHGAVEYHFCSEVCAGRFRAAPDRYVAQQHRDDHVVAPDRTRLTVASQLGRAYERGCLEHAELEDRLDRAVGARTQGELRDLTRDLPRHWRRAGSVRAGWMLTRRRLRALGRAARRHRASG